MTKSHEFRRALHRPVVLLPLLPSGAWACSADPPALDPLVTEDADLKGGRHSDAGSTDASTSSDGATSSDTSTSSDVTDASSTASDSAVAPSDAWTASDAAPMTSTLVIDGQSNVVCRGLRITTTSGDCVKIVNSTNVTIEGSDIGPCDGNGVYVSGGSGAVIADNYIHPENLASGCCDSHDGVLTTNTKDVLVQGNVIAYGETNIEAQSGSDRITVSGNFLLNPRGPFPRGQNFQASLATNITVTGNYALSSLDTSKYLFPEHQEDSINFWQTNTFTASNNYVTGGHSASGCGIIVDDRSNYGQFSNNELYDTGTCGIGVADGVGHRIDGNKVLNLDPVSGGGNTAIYVWKQYTDNTLGCGGTGSNQITVSNNVATGLKTDMTTESGWWNGGGCEPLNISGNTFDDGTTVPPGGPAYQALYPASSNLIPPLIPPGPRTCVARSPYSTQTSVPPCP